VYFSWGIRNTVSTVLEVGGALVDHLQTLVDGEERLLGRVGHHRHDQLVEDPKAALDDVEVAVVHGIEHPRVDGALGH
jgi:hypothetical protein